MQNKQKINFFEVTNSSTGQSDVLKSPDRVLGLNLNDYKTLISKIIWITVDG